ncbi:outer membrane lipoprotein carrier protein LolA [Rhodovulum sulfidophilum]|uniref:Outer membrane lipoprotein carrier protein LolA n=1 Tax=Rhodovulum sulfidophilum TaxID=35806 RepID=A0A0D6AYI8_RHOSU|nr:outer membrane lipoprotein carrier protein LolA [Rhodovulum sulfidophilum]
MIRFRIGLGGPKGGYRQRAPKWGRQAFKRRAAPPQVSSEPETDQSAPDRFRTRSDAISVSTGPEPPFVHCAERVRFELQMTNSFIKRGPPKVIIFDNRMSTTPSKPDSAFECRQSTRKSAILYGPQANDPLTLILFYPIGTHHMENKSPDVAGISN